MDSWSSNLVAVFMFEMDGRDLIGIFLVTESGLPGLGRRFERILPTNDWLKNGTGNDDSSPQDSVSMGDPDLGPMAVGDWRLTFAEKIAAWRKKNKSVSMISNEKRRTNMMSARRVGGPPGAPIRVLEVTPPDS